MTKKQSTLMLLAGGAAIVAGALSLFLPGHSDAAFRRWIGVAWLTTGISWALAWQMRPSRDGPDQRGGKRRS